MKVITLRGGNFRERNYVLVKLDIVAVIVAKDGRKDRLGSLG